MRANEIIRSIIDLIDQIDHGGQPSVSIAINSTPIEPPTLYVITDEEELLINEIAQNYDATTFMFNREFAPTAQKMPEFFNALALVKKLVALAKEPGRVFTREALLSEVWGYHHSTDTRLVNVHVQRLRSKIEHDPEHPEIVMTVRGVGYKAGGSA